MNEMRYNEEIREAQEIIDVFRENNVRLENEVRELKRIVSDCEDLCDVLLNIDNRCVFILADLMKKVLMGKRNVPAGRAEQGTTTKNNQLHYN